MTKLRILGLDDDNHAIKYRFETGELYESHELIGFLAHSHDIEYVVRVFSYIDAWSDQLEELGEDKVNNIFDVVAYEYDSSNLNSQECFEMLWKSAGGE